ncbi:MAG TPA: HlyD family efflux transporter periplasmic adaptor subunit [Limnobacter sp.]|nr:HlyD family efflux transporter periplasmic adaptor subunit [Limnobacter sp.]
MRKQQLSRDRGFGFSSLWTLAAVVCLLLAFAALANIDQAVRAQGQVIPSSRTQVIQAVDGGRVVAIHAAEGDVVRKGQLLAELEADRAMAAYEQVDSELASKRIALVRAQAELSEKTPQFAEADRQQWPEYVHAQTGVYRQRLQSLKQELSVQQSLLRLAEEDLQRSRVLLSSGDIGRSETIQAERRVLDLKLQIATVRNRYFQETRTEVAKLEEELASVFHKRQERANLLAHTRIVAPADGVVKLLRVTTVGAVAKAGDELMQLSPLDDELLVELKVNPADVAHLEPGLPVSLSFDAYDPSVYGRVEGDLIYISSDTLTENVGNQQPQTYYRARVTIDLSEASPASNLRLTLKDIKPGLAVTADILTGERSLLNYLFKPVNRALSGALLEK